MDLDRIGIIPDRDLTLARRAVIDRAIAHLRGTDPAVVLAQLADPDLRLHDHLRRDPQALAASLADGRFARGGRLFGAYKGAQQVLRAAGLPTN
ncbi:hypothetical protein [Nocardia sp. NPDC051570]|uniref:hypothetical protein n=1 Tax=Nocardia sp. NPDC051570 TaxID=3364324 RepID=UPI00379B1DA0